MNEVQLDKMNSSTMLSSNNGSNTNLNGTFQGKQNSNNNDRVEGEFLLPSSGEASDNYNDDDDLSSMTSATIDDLYESRGVTFRQWVTYSTMVAINFILGMTNLNQVATERAATPICPPLALQQGLCDPAHVCSYSSHTFPSKLNPNITIETVAESFDLVCGYSWQQSLIGKVLKLYIYIYIIVFMYIVWACVHLCIDACSIISNFTVIEFEILVHNNHPKKKIKITSFSSFT